MTERRTPEQLFELLTRHVGAWSPQRQQSHGFDLLFGDDDRLKADRRYHARRVLVGQHILGQQVAQHSSPMVLMKGLEVAQLYPNQLQRPFRDLDVLVRDARVRWDELVAQGYWQNPKRRLDIDHHHLPALADPTGMLGVELHHRPNVPGWATIPTELIFDTAQPSRTGVEGVLRPRDDVHALLMAMHCWKGGFTRQRDLFDAMLLAAHSDEGVEAMAASLGLRRFWRVTTRLAESVLFADDSKRVPMQRWIIPTANGIHQRARSQIVAPYLAVNPLRTSVTHARAWRAGRRLRSGSINRGDHEPAGS